MYTLFLVITVLQLLTIRATDSFKYWQSYLMCYYYHAWHYHNCICLRDNQPKVPSIWNNHNLDSADWSYTKNGCAASSYFRKGNRVHIVFTPFLQPTFYSPLFFKTIEQESSQEVSFGGVDVLQFIEQPNINQYEYGIDSEGHVFEGFVYEDVFKGSYIEVSHLEDEIIKEGERRVNYLRLKIIKGDKSMKNVKYDIVRTDAFEINEEGYIIVNNTEMLFEEKEVEFYVVLLNVPEEKIVSNPIPFIVRMEISVKPEATYPEAAAIFAGVLTLVIVVMALFIPFVVRMKRRYRAKQKSIKHSESVQKDKDSGLTKRVESKEPNWFANTEFKYEEEVEKEREEFTHDILDMAQGSSKPDDTIQLSKKSKLGWINPHAGDAPKSGILKNNGSYNQSDSKL